VNVTPPSPGIDGADEAAPIILFDGMCPLCAGNVQFVLKHDRQRRFRFASMQSEVGASLYRRFGIDPGDPETLILVTGDRALRDSEAILAIYNGLGWPWRLASAARALPAAVRDRLYRLVARNRYRLFGRRTSCWLPDPKWSDRFL
jgi:predicted DCC family thiol-disulfide oxidoreductase YuxK